MTEPNSSAVAAQVLALLRYGNVAPRLFDHLLQQFGSPAGILEASTAALRKQSGISAAVAERISKSAKRIGEAEKYIGDLRHRGIHVLTRFDDNYGHLLFELNDPPPLLYVRGSLPVPKEKSVTLIGSRNASADGIALTTRVAQLFAQAQIRMVSSLEGGNDSAVHLGAKAAGGRSYAVIESGFDQLDQTTQVPLAIDIALTGGVISESAPEVNRSAESMEMADRLLVGISQATVLTEIYQESRREHDVLKFCSDIGKMAFVIVDDEFGPLADAESLSHATECGAIIMHSPKQIGDITRSLV